MALWLERAGDASLDVKIDSLLKLDRNEYDEIPVKWDDLDGMGKEQMKHILEALLPYRAQIHCFHGFILDDLIQSVGV